jgi:hypothetical protein
MEVLSGIYLEALKNPETFDNVADNSAGIRKGNSSNKI